MGRRPKRGGPTGVLLVDKPRGLTSFQVVAQVRRLMGSGRAGHTGTLDPMATGLLPICLGDATRIATFLTAGDKAYRAEVRLGISTDSLDAEGEVLREDPPEAWSGISAEAVEAALEPLRGPILQRPPALSAIKIDGERAYARARRGETLVMAERPVTVHRLELVALRLPLVDLNVRCSKGTYVRSLALALGEGLGLGAHLSALRRVAVGPLDVAESTPLEALIADPASARAKLLDCSTALKHLPALRLDEAEVARIRFGQTFETASEREGLHRALDGAGVLIAVVTRAADGRTGVVRGFPPPGT